MDDKAVREALLNADCVRSAADDNSVCVSTQTYDTIRAHVEAQAAELAELRRALGMVAHQGPLIEGVRALQAECSQHLQQALENGQAAQTAERRCAELVALVVAMRSVYGPLSDTLKMKHGTDPRTFAERINTLTGDDRHAG